MAKMKLKVAQVRNLHPGSKKVGYYARIITRGTAGYDRLVETVCRNTSIHRSEAKVALDLCMEGVAELLAEGYIVDLGPVGRLYPSCSSGWKASAAELKLADVKPSLYYRPTRELATAIEGASLQWVREGTATTTASNGSATSKSDIDG